MSRVPATSESWRQFAAMWNFGPPLELPHIDDAAAMGAIADLAIAVPGLDLDGISATK
jgi:hypothetical protein